MYSSKEKLVEIANLEKWFPIRTRQLTSRLLGTKKYLRAVDNVALNIHKAEIVGLAGESGSGKSTLGELIVRLQDPTRGNIFFKGDDISLLDKRTVE